MSILFVILSLLLLQQPGAVLINTIPGKGEFITTDNLGNVYLKNNNIILKYNKEGKLLYTYSDKLKGNIDFIDVTDPFKILVLYKNFGEIIFLDNTLTVKGEPVHLNKYNIELSSLACTSYESGLWLFEPYSNKLVRINSSTSISHESANINQITGFKINPVFMTENNGFLYLADYEKGIIVLDKFGTYSKTIDLKGLSNFQVSGDNIFFIRNDKIFSYNIKSNNQELYLQIPAEKALMVQLQRNILYILTENNLIIYSINEK